MNKFKLSILIGIFSICASGTINAQSNAELKLYQNIKKKQNISLINKFLNTYPTSQYANEVSFMRDSINFYSLNNTNVNDYVLFLTTEPSQYYKKKAQLEIKRLNTSSISNSKALSIAEELIESPYKVQLAKGIKYFNTETIIAVSYSKENENFFQVSVIQYLSGKWTIIKNLLEERFTNNKLLDVFNITPENEVSVINGEPLLLFSYTNTSNQVNEKTKIPNNDIEYIVNLYSIRDNSIFYSTYSGMIDTKDKDSIRVKMPTIYGSTLEENNRVIQVEEMQYLNSYIRHNPNIKPMGDVFLNKKIYNWWYSNNTESYNANSLSFGIINPESSIVEDFKKCKDKFKVGNYTVAYFNKDSITMVVVYNSTNDIYSMAWCSPAPQKSTDLTLASVYQEKGNVIIMYFYQKNNAIKKRLNLVTKKLY